MKEISHVIILFKSTHVDAVVYPDLHSRERAARTGTVNDGNVNNSFDTTEITTFFLRILKSIIGEKEKKKKLALFLNMKNDTKLQAKMGKTRLPAKAVRFKPACLFNL